MRIQWGGRGFFITLLFFIAVLDRATKWSALFFSPKGTVTLNDSFFSLVHIPQGIMMALIGVLFFVCLGWLVHARGMPHIALFYILLGMGSNLTDRIVYGGVVDWIALRGISTFNIADICIIIGVLFLCIDLFSKTHRRV